MKNRSILTLLSMFIMTMAIMSAAYADSNSKYSSSINFYGEKTDVHMGEEILTKLSIVNLVSNPKMHGSKPFASTNSFSSISCRIFRGSVIRPRSSNAWSYSPRNNFMSKSYHFFPLISILSHFSRDVKGSFHKILNRKHCIILVFIL